MSEPQFVTGLETGEPVAVCQYRKDHATGEWFLAGEVVIPGMVPTNGMLCVVEKRNRKCDFCITGEVIWLDGAGNFTAHIAQRQNNVA